MQTTLNLGTATYSPEDNKLRLSCFSRLSKDDYTKARSTGFIWAPKQEIFVAPMWTPDREDLLLEWCGQIEDEDKSLVERAEERADRFEDYSDKRKVDADNAHAAVASICDGIPLGQPILVGHHSERHARKDAERIENGMRKAIKLWETSKYWQDRARSAITHAKYKERPDVRARRIKGIEADKRKSERTRSEAETCIKFWTGKLVGVAKDGTKTPIEITEANRERICNLLGNSSTLSFYASRGIDGQSHYSGWDVLRPDCDRYKNCPAMTVAALQVVALNHYDSVIERCNRWLAHYENRLTYERTMLEADGGTATDKKGPEKGGAVKCWASVRGCWSYIQKVNKVSVTVLDNWGNGGGNFTRTIPFDKCSTILSASEVKEARDAGRLVETSCKTGFGLRGDDTARKAVEATDERSASQNKEVVEAKQTEDASFKAMRETLKAGVQVVSAPQLFPTPPDVAQQMVELADLHDGLRVLEPSAGSGQILGAICHNVFTLNVQAVEINAGCVRMLQAQKDAGAYTGATIMQADFLALNGELGKFDRILMNPPFANGSDIKHIDHARQMLNFGGRLVAICANGPRQQEKLKPLASTWIDLPQGTFKEQGTNVNTALLVIDGPK